MSLQRVELFRLPKQAQIHTNNFFFRGFPTDMKGAITVLNILSSAADFAQDAGLVRLY